MMMKVPVDVEKIAKRLRAERRGKVIAAGGYFGAAPLAGDVQARCRQLEDRRRPVASPAGRSSDDGEG